jgi:polysaccharide export outer membrane protein
MSSTIFRHSLRALWVGTLVFLFASCAHRPGQEGGPLVVDAPNDTLLVKAEEKKESLRPHAGAAGEIIEPIEGVAVKYIPEYRIGPGDVLEIAYLMHYARTEETYTLTVQDKITVVFPFQPQLNSQSIVRSDGKISLPLVGEVQVESLRPEDVEGALKKLYAKYIIDPVLTVSLEESQVKVNELKKAITNSSRGQSKVAPVAPDGRIALPMIGNIQAAGLTLREFERTVNERYGEQIRNLRATVILSEIHHSKCYILGEVQRPGAYEMQHQANMLNCLALAGGVTKQATLSRVLVIRSEGLEKPIAFFVNLDRGLEDGVVYKDLPVKPADIIYVPKGALAKANDFIEMVFTKGLYSVLPFNSAFTVNYDLNGSTVK